MLRQVSLLGLSFGILLVTAVLSDLKFPASVVPRFFSFIFFELWGLEISLLGKN